MKHRGERSTGFSLIPAFLHFLGRLYPMAILVTGTTRSAAIGAEVAPDTRYGLDWHVCAKRIARTCHSSLVGKVLRCARTALLGEELFIVLPHDSDWVVGRFFYRPAMNRARSVPRIRFQARITAIESHRRAIAIDDAEVCQKP